MIPRPQKFYRQTERERQREWVSVWVYVCVWVCVCVRAMEYDQAQQQHYILRMSTQKSEYKKTRITWLMISLVFNVAVIMQMKEKGRTEERI
jgi:hypothetical protein